jgi:hypothetical protein
VAAFYADENFPEPTAVALRALGHDVLTVRGDGRDNQGIGDPLVLARATALGRGFALVPSVNASGRGVSVEIRAALVPHAPLLVDGRGLRLFGGFRAGFGSRGRFALGKLVGFGSVHDCESSCGL